MVTVVPILNFSTFYVRSNLNKSTLLYKGNFTISIIKMWLCTFIAICTCLTSFISADWVDPHSMDSSTKSKLKTSTDIGNVNPQYCSNAEITCYSDLYLKRIIRLLLTYAKFHESDDPLIGKLNIELRKTEYDFLSSFAKSDKTSELELSEVISIFETAFHEPYFEMLLTRQEQLFLLLFSRATGALVVALIVCYITYKLMQCNVTLGVCVKFLIFLLYVADFAITYLRLVQKEEIKTMVKIKTLGTIPPECDPNKMDWWTYIKSNFVENKCHEYYEATYDAYSYLVTPIEIVTYQFKRLIFEPFGEFGEAIGKFSSSLFTSLPWYGSLFLFPFIFIVVCIVFLIILGFYTGSSVDIGSPFLFMLKFKGRRVESKPETQQSVRIIHMTDRNAIEDVHNNSDSKPSLECDNTPRLKESNKKNKKKRSAATRLPENEERNLVEVVEDGVINDVTNKDKVEEDKKTN